MPANTTKRYPDTREGAMEKTTNGVPWVLENMQNVYLRYTTKTHISLTQPPCCLTVAVKCECGP